MTKFNGFPGRDPWRWREHAWKNRRHQKRSGGWLIAVHQRQLLSCTNKCAQCERVATGEGGRGIQGTLCIVFTTVL